MVLPGEVFVQMQGMMLGGTEWSPASGISLTPNPVVWYTSLIDACLVSRSSGDANGHCTSCKLYMRDGSEGEKDRKQLLFSIIVPLSKSVEDVEDQLVLMDCDLHITL